MNKTLSMTLTVIAVIALAAVVFFAGSMYARANAFGPSMMSGYGWNNNNAYGPSMMNGGGPNMMGGNGGMMNGSTGMGPNMMGGYGYNPTNVTPLTIDQTKAAAEKYMANLDNSDLEVAEIMIFDNNGYVIVKEISTGIGAFELLVDPTSQIVYPEHGPNMMWNLKYSGLNHQYMMGVNGGMMGMMGGNNGMMNGWNSATPLDVTAELTVTPEQAVQYAQQYLDTNYAGATAATDPAQFYGYYTLDFEKDGKIIGMLSVNGYSGQIFLHTWHGTFIEETE
ncbi:MAG: hypothetical protein KF758_10580 [Anaerolineales bacterium]|jgi:hypothetical protein|nr:hypothetical protein [Anaerolineales bacterium]MBI5705290.1 hypothetical protein [Chloroflexota bacterium]NJC97178.1 hypothetical protein [Anaerolineae bacterium]RJP55680.1 MAG: hypothetical protein C4583_00015 [Anaerolineaceae bacterium]MBE7435521.1 hypothetical protein [Anaerolineales bacterium]